MDLPAPLLATLDAMRPEDRAALLERVEAMESPAQMWLTAWHLMQGDGAYARIVAFLPADMFARHDDAIRMAFLMGRMDGER